MIDYSLLQTLVAIVETGSFLKAAEALHLTQSAVSQRIQSLENSFGAPLITRTPPPSLTQSGEILVAHYRQVAAMEREVAVRVGLSEAPDTHLTFPVAVNTESMACWFFDAMNPVAKKHRVLLQVRIADQDITANLLRNGSVLGAVSSESQPLPGCSVHSLGAMLYHCCSSKEFKEKYFAHGFTEKAIAIAPAVIYDATDRLHQEFLSRVFRTTNVPRHPQHMIPSPEGIVRLIQDGLGYGVIPESMMTSGLVNLVPKHQYRLRLYWHSLTTRSEMLRDFHGTVVSSARKLLQL